MPRLSLQQRIDEALAWCEEHSDYEPDPALVARVQSRTQALLNWVLDNKAAALWALTIMEKVSAANVWARKDAKAQLDLGYYKMLCQRGGLVSMGSSSPFWYLRSVICRD